MKGIVFSEFFELVEDQFGFEMVDKLIEQTLLASGGAYTSVGNYHHQELVDLVSNLSKFTTVSVNELLVIYGQHLFPILITLAPELIKQFNNTLEFLAAVDSIIHVEVKKLYPDAELPVFNIIKQDDHELQMVYISQRPFAYLAKGLIMACAQHYNDQFEITLENRDEDNLFIINY